MGDKSLNAAGAAHASSLISAGKISDDKSWSAPSAEKSDEYAKTHSMSELGKWYLGQDASMDKEDKGHWAYPFSSDYILISLRGLRAIITRAAQAGAKAIEEKAEKLYEEAKKKAGKDNERSQTAVSRILVRKSMERLDGQAKFRSAVVESGYTATDLFRWLGDELDGCRPNGFEDDQFFCCWPCNFIMPAHEQGETWQVVCQGSDGQLYMIDFRLGDCCVEILNKPQPVTSKEQFVIVDEMMEQADDEAHGRTEETKKARKLNPDFKYRIMEVTPEQADNKDYTIPASFASENPGVQRCDPFGEGRSDCERAAGITSGDDYVEVLSHEAEHVDYSALNSGDGGPVLDEHDPKDQIGVVKPGSAYLDKGVRVSRCVLRMDGESEKGKLRFRQMRNKIRTGLSTGYKHTKFIKKTTLPDGQTAYHFACRFMEVTSTAIPMDGNIGAGRNVALGMVYRSLADLPRVDLANKTRSSETHIESKAKSMTPEEIKVAADANAKAIADAVAKERTDTEARVRAEEAVKITTASTTSAGNATTTERKRFDGISVARNELLKARPDQAKEIQELADGAIRDGTSEGDFKFKAMTTILQAKPAETTCLTSLGFTEKDRSDYRILNGIQNVIEQREKGKGMGVMVPDPDTLEGQYHARAAKIFNEKGKACRSTNGEHVRGSGFMVPIDAYGCAPTGSTQLHSRSRAQLMRHMGAAGMMKRDATMQSTLFNQGGATVATEVLLPIVDLLRNEMVTTKLGVTSMAGLEGDIVIPRQAAPATAYSVGETGALALSGQILDQISLAPKRAGTWCQYSKQFLLQSTLDVESFIRTDMFAVIALYWDEMILNGQGAGDQPTGILNTPGVLLVNGTGNFTGYSGDNNAPAWVDIVNFDTQINKVNGRRQGRGWATTSNARGRLESLAKLLVGATTVPSEALWKAMESDVDGFGMGAMKGYPAVDSQQIPNDQLILGVWAMNVIHAMWGGLDIVVDPFTGAGQSLVKIYMNTWGDVALRHPQEFCISLAPASA